MLLLLLFFFVFYMTVLIKNNFNGRFVYPFSFVIFLFHVCLDLLKAIYIQNYVFLMNSPFYNYNITLTLVIFVILKSTLSVINIDLPVFLLLWFALLYLCNHFIFILYNSSYLMFMFMFCKQHIVESCLYLCLVSKCLPCNWNFQPTYI